MNLLNIKKVGWICFLKNILDEWAGECPERGNPHIILNKRARVGGSWMLT